MKISGEEADELVKMAEKLPYEAQYAVAWLVRNFDFAKALIQGELDSGEQVEKFYETAVQKRDYFTLVILGYKKCLDQKPSQDEPEN